MYNASVTGHTAGWYCQVIREYGENP